MAFRRWLATRGGRNTGLLGTFIFIAWLCDASLVFALNLGASHSIIEDSRRCWCTAEIRA